MEVFLSCQENNVYFCEQLNSLYFFPISGHVHIGFKNIFRENVLIGFRFFIESNLKLELRKHLV